MPQGESGRRCPAYAERAGANELLQLVKSLELLGLDRDELCRRIGLDPACLEEPGLRVERRFFPEMFAAAEILCGDRLVGLHAAEKRGAHGLLGQLAAVQPTVEQFLDAFQRFSQIALDSLRIVVERQPPWVWVRGDLGPSATAHGREYTTVLIGSLLGEADHHDAGLREVHFPHLRQGPESEYRRVLGADVRFVQPEWAFSLPESLLGVPLRRSNPEVARALRAAAELQLHAARAGSAAEQVAQVLRTSFDSGGDARPEVVARRLGVSLRTLQRDLHSEGTTFRQVRDRVREQLAAILLRDPSLRISEVAVRVGFQDVASFGSAFKRWTGSTPRDFRRRGTEAG